ncbi:MAG: acyclic terpene utilization AtuA family protein [Candidatus Omnitrophota bacterium]
MDEIRILTPNGSIGSGFPQGLFEEGMKRNPHAIAVDAGSTDPGPYFLGKGVSISNKMMIKRDIEILLLARDKNNIPLLVGSACGPGTKSTLKWTIDIVQEIAREKNLHFKLAVIPGDIDKEFLKNAVRQGKVRVFESGKALTVEEVDRAANIVAQMGVEPFIEALKSKPDVIIAGRAYDPAMMAALPIMNGFDQALAEHMGKILECGSMAAEPSSGFEPILGTIRKGCFLVEPMNPKSKCTPKSVADHSLYEECNPLKAGLPGGTLDLTQTVFEQTGRMTKVSGTKFIKDAYTVKVEGAAKVGYRTVFIAGVRDPIMVSQIDYLIDEAVKNTKAFFCDVAEDFQILFHVYGKNGVLGKAECIKDARPFELGLVGEVVAKTQELASTICGYLSHLSMHLDYPGCKATAGNLAMLYSPENIDTGEVFEFNIYHLLEVDSPTELFPISYEEI